MPERRIAIVRRTKPKKKKTATKTKRVKVRTLKEEEARKRRECLQKVMKFTMEQRKRGTLRDAGNAQVTERKQALAIGFRRANDTCGSIPDRNQSKRLAQQRKARATLARAKKAAKKNARAPATRARPVQARKQRVAREVIVKRNGRFVRTIVYT